MNRRDFLKLLSAVPVAAVLPVLVKADTRGGFGLAPIKAEGSIKPIVSMG